MAKTKKPAPKKVKAPIAAVPEPASVLMPSPQPQTGRANTVRAGEFRKRFGL